MVPKRWRHCECVVCVWDRKPQRGWLEIAIKISMLRFVVLSKIPAVGLFICWNKESMWKCLHSMCVYYQSPSAFIWLFWCVQFLIWCFLVTFLIQRQSPKKDWHLLVEVELAEKWVSSAPFLMGKLSLWNNTSQGLKEKGFLHLLQLLLSQSPERIYLISN